jgi:hypothetical protein
MVTGLGKEVSTEMSGKKNFEINIILPGTG